METRSSHLLVGLFVLVGALALGATGVWFAKTDIDSTYDEYDIVFTGSVNGLQEGAAVKWRGVPVGRVKSVTIDEDINNIIAMIEVDAGTPVKADTTAVLTLQGITGLADIELRGGSANSAQLETPKDRDRPRIQSARSAIEQVFDSTPELLTGLVAMMERTATLLSPENIEAATEILASTRSITAQIDVQLEKLEPLLVNATAATDAVGLAASEATLTMRDVQDLMASAEGDLTTLLDNGIETLATGEEAAAAVRNLSYSLDRTLEKLERPLDDFSQSGLYDFTEMVRETRQLVASLTRITTEFERDPAGFLIGGNQRGFSPE